MRPILAEAVDVARRALLELQPEGVGEHLGVTAEDEYAATHHFATTLSGYRGWQWAVVVAAPPEADRATVSESALLPGPDALVAPDFVPWDQRVRPGDLAPGDLLAPLPGDPRLVPGYVVTGDPVVDDVCEELGQGRPQVLSREGRAEAAERWFTEYGPDTEMARAAPSTCRLCGFYVPLAGALRASYGVCANALGADGHVVHAEYGCGAHSDTELPTGGGSPRYEAYDDAAVELVSPEELRKSSATTPGDVVVPDASTAVAREDDSASANESARQEAATSASAVVSENVSTSGAVAPETAAPSDGAAVRETAAPSADVDAPETVTRSTDPVASAAAPEVVEPQGDPVSPDAVVRENSAAPADAAVSGTGESAAVAGESAPVESHEVATAAAGSTAEAADVTAESSVSAADVGVSTAGESTSTTAETTSGRTSGESASAAELSAGGAGESAASADAVVSGSGESPSAVARESGESTTAEGSENTSSSLDPVATENISSGDTGGYQAAADSVVAERASDGDSDPDGSDRAAGSVSEVDAGAEDAAHEAVEDRATASGADAVNGGDAPASAAEADASSDSAVAEDVSGPPGEAEYHDAWAVSAVRVRHGAGGASGSAEPS